MSNIPFVIEIDSLESFQENVIDKSFQLPIVVDFWADWCQPCKILLPLLTKISQQYNGAFILAKVNSDQQQDLALQHGVKSLPTVLIFNQGEIVDSFTGAIAESEITVIIDKYVSNPVNEAINQCLTLVEQGNTDTALEQLKQLNQQYPENFDIHLAIAKVYLQTQAYALCQQLLVALPANIKEQDSYKSLFAQLEVAQAVANAPELEKLEQQIKNNPEDLELQLQLANIYISKQNHQQALEVLFSMVKTNSSYNEEIAKTTMLKVFEILGNSNALVRQYRKKLFSFYN